MHPNRTAEPRLERLPNGEYALLYPQDEDPRYVLTDQGRRAGHGAPVRRRPDRRRGQRRDSLMAVLSSPGVRDVAGVPVEATPAREFDVVPRRPR